MLVVQLGNLVDPFFALVRYLFSLALKVSLQLVLHLDRQVGLLDIAF